MPHSQVASGERHLALWLFGWVANLPVGQHKWLAVAGVAVAFANANVHTDPVAATANQH